MQLIAFGDIHMAPAIVATIPGIDTADCLLVTGDITNFGHREEAGKVLNEILIRNPHLLCLAGNLDNSDVNDYLEDLEMNLHGQAHVIKRQVCVYGVGGSNYTPFRTPWEFSEDGLAKIVGDAYLHARELIRLAKPLVGYTLPTILVSHAPPYGTSVDRLKSGKHVGSKAIRRFIEKFSPDLCLTGHIHEGKGSDTIGTTTILNPGMFGRGGWVTINIRKRQIDTRLQ